MSADIGDVFEKQIESVFRKLKDQHLMQWHTFPDHKRSGGGAVGTQPSDYLLGLPPGSAMDQRMFFLEAKASDKYPSLQKAMISSGQRGAALSWSGLAHLPYRVIFYSAVSNNLEVWDGMCVSTPKLDKNKYLLATLNGAGAGRELDEQRVFTFLADFFGLPHKSLTLKNYQG